jgi:hypothetical protein
MGIKPQDVLVALKLIANPEASWSYPKLASAIHLSTSETLRQHSSIECDAIAPGRGR